MKELLSSMGWISKSLVLAFGFALFPFLITSFSQKGIKPEVTMSWYTLGMPIGLFILSCCGGGGLVTENHKDFFASPWLLTLALFFGTTIGVVLNTFYGQAMQSAPNPALAFAVINSSIVIIYILAPVFHKIFPKVFPAATVNWTSAGGIILTLAGVVLVAKGK